MDTAKIKSALLKALLAFAVANLVVFIDEEWPWVQHYANPYARLALAFSWLTAVVMIETVIRVDRRLGRTLGWAERPNLRLWLQLLFGLVLPAGMLLAMSVLYFHFGPHDGFPRRYLILEYPINLALLAAFNGYFLLPYPYWPKAWRTEGPIRQETATRLIEVSDATGKWMMDPSGIDCITHQNKCYTVYLDNGEVVFANQSLSVLENLLDQFRFFKINPSCIVRMDAIKEVKKHGVRGLVLVLHRECNANLVVSQRQTPRFKKWIEYGTKPT